MTLIIYSEHSLLFAKETLAISKTLSRSAAPPINPLAWTKIAVGILLTSWSSLSLSPLQSFSNGTLRIKDSGETGTACTLHVPFWSVKRTYLISLSIPVACSILNKWSFQGQPPAANSMILPI